MLRKKRIKLNGGRADGHEILQEGDVIKLYLSPETIDGFRTAREIPAAQPLVGIIHEDENMLVVNKPAGLASHGGMASGDHLLARILYYLYKTGVYSPDATFAPAICNRLDMNTSGVVICGKNLRTLQNINAAFKNREAQKEYLAVVDGIMGQPGESKTLTGLYQKDTSINKATIIPNSPQGKLPPTIHEGQQPSEAITAYTILATASGKTLLNINPITGRSHQIRAHMAAIGHPLCGDKKYGGKPTPHAPAQLLHCHKITIAGRTFEATPPQNFSSGLQEIFGRDVW